MYFIVYSGVNFLFLKKTFIPGPGEMTVFGVLCPIIFLIVFSKRIKKTETTDLQKTLSILAATVFHITLGISSIVYIIKIWGQI